MLAEAYLAATREKKKNGQHKSALVVSPTHAEGGRITATIRATLKAEDKLGEERTLATWLSAQPRCRERRRCQLRVGEHAAIPPELPGHKSGSRLVVAQDAAVPVQYANRFEVYRPATLALAVGDRVRVTANGRSKDGKHKLANG